MAQLSGQEVQFGTIKNHLGFHIRRTYSYFSRTFVKYGRKYDIKSQQATILCLAQNNPGISPAVVAVSTEMKRPLMARLSADLESRGLIEMRPSLIDKRQKGLFITPKGEGFLKEVLDSFFNELEPRLTRNLSKQERITLIELLEKVYKN